MDDQLATRTAATLERVAGLLRGGARPTRDDVQALHRAVAAVTGDMLAEPAERPTQEGYDHPEA